MHKKTLLTCFRTWHLKLKWHLNQDIEQLKEAELKY